MIEAKKITKAYPFRPDVLVLNDVSFRINKGENVAIVGRSGSGKTTLLNMIGTLDKPSGGSVTINGTDIYRMSEEEKADFRRNEIGFVFQLFHLIPQYTILENVMMPLKPYQRKITFDLRKRAREVINWVGLAQRMDAFPDTLSGGEQQRVALARALVNHPKIILADEPTGNLDADTGSGIIQLLQRIKQEEGITIMMVTHNEEIAHDADRILRLQDGQILMS